MQGRPGWWLVAVRAGRATLLAVFHERIGGRKKKRASFERRSAVSTVAELSPIRDLGLNNSAQRLSLAGNLTRASARKRAGDLESWAPPMPPMKRLSRAKNQETVVAALRPVFTFLSTHLFEGYSAHSPMNGLRSKLMRGLRKCRPAKSRWRTMLVLRTEAATKGTDRRQSCLQRAAISADTMRRKSLCAFLVLLPFRRQHSWWAAWVLLLRRQVPVRALRVLV